MAKPTAYYSYNNPDAIYGAFNSIANAIKLYWPWGGDGGPSDPSAPSTPSGDNTPTGPTIGEGSNPKSEDSNAPADGSSSNNPDKPKKTYHLDVTAQQMNGGKGYPLNIAPEASGSFVSQPTNRVVVPLSEYKGPIEGFRDTLPGVGFANDVSESGDSDETPKASIANLRDAKPEVSNIETSTSKGKEVHTYPPKQPLSDNEIKDTVVIHMLDTAANRSPSNYVAGLTDFHEKSVNPLGKVMYSDGSYTPGEEAREYLRNTTAERSELSKPKLGFDKVRSISDHIPSPTESIDSSNSSTSDASSKKKGFLGGLKGRFK